MRSKNIDPAEIAKFDAISADWWNIEGEFKPLHEINPIRLKFITDRIPIKDKIVVDIGCGGGILAESLARQGAQVTGIDMSPTALSAAKQHLQISQLDIDYQLMTAEELAAKTSHVFDVVTCLEMLEHVPDPFSIVRACAQLVKPSGHIFFSTLNRTLKAYLQAIIGAEYVLRLLPKGTHDYAKFIRPAELDSWARESDLTVRELSGLTYNPLTKQYGLSHSVDVNYLAWYIK